MVTSKARAMEGMRIQKGLDEELDRLKGVMGLDQGLAVVWRPNANEGLSGEVKGNKIFIYEPSENEALNALRHELVDYLVSQAIEPYKEVTNALIKTVNEDAYRTKERVVRALTRLCAERSG